MPKKPKKRTAAARATHVPARETAAGWLPARPYQALLVVILVGYALASWLLLWSYVPIDDAFISFRYAHHLASGEGLAFNPGERVEGYSSLSWVLLLAAGDALGLDLPDFARWLGLILGAGTLFLLSAGAFETRSRLLAAALLAAYLPTAYHFINGLETSLMAFLVTALVLHPFGLPGGPWVRWAHPAVAALLVLTRPEGLLCVLHWIAAVWIADRHSVSRRELAILGLTAMATWAAQTAFRWWYHGDWMANSARAKLLPLSFALPHGLADLAGFAVQGSAYGLLLLFFVAGAVVSWRRRGEERPESVRFLALALFVVLFGLALAASGGDSFPLWRFYVPLAPVFFLCAAAGLALVAGAGHRAPRRRAGGGAWTLAAAALAVALCLPYPGYLERMEVESSWTKQWEAIGRSLARRFPPDTRMALCPVGAVPFYSGLPTIDMLGLNEPKIARKAPDRQFFYPGHLRHDGPYVLSLEPDLVMLANGPVVSSPSFQFPWRSVRFYEKDVVFDPRFRSGYQLIHVPLGSGKYAQLFARTRFLERAGDLPGVIRSPAAMGPGSRL